MKRITKAQQRAIHKVWMRDYRERIEYLATGDWSGRGRIKTYLQFRRTVQAGFDCLMVFWRGMWLGIEPDGYTHS